MALTLSELIEIQRQFDQRHQSNGRSWADPIGEQDTAVLLELVVALAGEVGELANVAKKIARGDFGLNSARSEITSELADIFIYVLKLASQLNIDLEQAHLDKLSLNEDRFARFRRD